MTDEIGHSISPPVKLLLIAMFNARRPAALPSCISATAISSHARHWTAPQGQPASGWWHTSL